ncbi:MAG TPA: NADPH:quinone reductase [Ottowia sp.]|uniref:NADPH:quinone reductase n=1 Tax=Ottowia sp. TaxID=1898956 RepID=UPI002BB08A21|nr:NADPH:quinone reductase [Ottowia sp.]HMN22682.1 NADPH:quinone reductase [Ottowia sp.]
MDIPHSMRAAFIRRTGDVDQIEVADLPVPRPGPTDVLVRMTASVVNPVDLFVRSGAYRTHLPFPFVIGRDLVGTVVQPGPGVSGFRPGDAVWCNSLGHHGRQGAFAQYAVVASERLYPLPSGVAPEQAVAVLHPAATAHLGLVREARLQKGETLLVEGAGGAVGSALVQMAHDTGARVLATAAAGDAPWCTACGASAVFDYHDPRLAERIAGAAPDGVDVWWDTSGHNDLARCLPRMAPRGRIVVMSGLGRGDVPLPMGALYARDLRLLGFAISNASADELADAARHLNRLLASGALRARIGARFQLADAARAHAALAGGRVRGRIIILP